MLAKSNFSFSHGVFYTSGEPCAIFIKLETVVCKLFVWKSLKFVIREKVNLDWTRNLSFGKKLNKIQGIILQIIFHTDKN